MYIHIYIYIYIYVYYTGVDPKQLIGIHCWYRLGHLSWVTCPGSLVIDSLVLGVLVVLGGNKYFTSLYITLLCFTCGHLSLGVCKAMQATSS